MEMGSSGTAGREEILGFNKLHSQYNQLWTADPQMAPENKGFLDLQWLQWMHIFLWSVKDLQGQVIYNVSISQLVSPHQTTRTTIFNKTMAWNFIKHSRMALHVTSSYLWYIVLQWRQLMVFIWMFSPSANALCIHSLTLCPFGIHFRGDTQWLCKDGVIFSHSGKLSNYWLRTMGSISDFILQNF